AQGVQASPGPTDVARQHRQVDQAARVIGAGRVLRDAHAPENHGALGFAIGPRYVNNVLFGHSRQARYDAWGVVLDSLTELIELLRALLDELLVVQPFPDDDMHHAVE